MIHSEDELSTSSNGAKQSKISNGWMSVDLAALNAMSGEFQSTIQYLRDIVIDARKAGSPTELHETYLYLIGYFGTANSHLEYITQVFATGSKKYGLDNWRGLTPYDNFLHFYRHLIRYQLTADPEDYAHMHTRLHMLMSSLMNPEYKGVFKPTEAK